jgi:AcrR family transcriptional regulator
MQPRPPAQASGAIFCGKRGSYTARGIEYLVESVDLPTVAAWLGHERLDTVRIYSQPLKGNPPERVPLDGLGCIRRRLHTGRLDVADWLATGTAEIPQDAPFDLLVSMLRKANPWLQSTTGRSTRKTEDLAGKVHRMAATGKKYRTGITTEQIVEAAVELTRQRGLYGWAIRDLVAAIGTSPSVVYHRVGGRDALCRRVAAYVLAQIEYEFPADGDPQSDPPDWRAWFRAELFPMRPILTQYPGVAKWILMHGRVISENIDRFDADMDRLHSAGFRDDAALVFALIFNTAMTAMMMTDERVAHDDDDPRDHARIIAELHAARGRASDEMAAFIEPFTGDRDQAQAATDAYYRTLINTLLDGLEQRRLRGASNADQTIAEGSSRSL